MPLIDHVHVKYAGVELEVNPDGERENVLVVETDLQLDVQHPNYDKQKVDSLLIAVHSYIKRSHSHIRARIRTVR